MTPPPAPDAAFDETALAVGAGLAQFDADTLDLLRRWFALGYAAGRISQCEDIAAKFGVVLGGGK